MKSFNFDRKTGRLETRQTTTIEKEEIKVLLFMRNNGHSWAGGYATREQLEELLANRGDETTPDDREDHIFQILHDIMWHLEHELRFVEYEADKSTYVGTDKKTKQNKYEKITGYFLTDDGKAFCSIFGKRKNTDENA